MNSGEMLYGVNHFVISLGIIILLLLTIEAGFRLGNRVPRDISDSAKSPVLAISGAIFGLLALLLGFTFSMALSRFEHRKALVIKEANAIGTAYLRTSLLPEQERADVADLMRSYVDVRLDFHNLRVDGEQQSSVILRTDELKTKLWSYIPGVVQKDDRPTTTGLFIQSLNEVIDLEEERRVAMENHVPESVLALLLLVAVLAATLVGYGCGLAKIRHVLSTSIMAFLIGLVIMVIIDLDRPRRGLIRVEQTSMIRLRDSIKAR